MGGGVANVGVVGDVGDDGAEDLGKEIEVGEGNFDDNPDNGGGNLRGVVSGGVADIDVSVAEGSNERLLRGGNADDDGDDGPGEVYESRCIFFDLRCRRLVVVLVGVVANVLGGR